jgi:hypothetical protein
MPNAPAKLQDAPSPEVVEDVLMRGNWAELTPQQRNDHNIRVCKSLGMNPLTNPFGYIMLGGKLVFYAKKDATDQLRKINGISVEIVSQEVSADGLLTVTARATDKTGRVDSDIGVVNIKSLVGDFAANARMKAVTKAKRRVTLSISGLGFLDETETDEPSEDNLIADADPPVEPRPYKITAQSWRMFGELLSKELRDAETKSDVFEWLKANEEPLAKMKKEMPKMYDTLNATIEAIKAEPT